MTPYNPLYIKGVETGLVQERQEFILPDDAFPVLENAFVWREQIKRRQGLELLGRLQRQLFNQSLGTSGGSVWSFNIYSTLSPAIVSQPNAQIVPGSVIININASTITDTVTGYANATDCEVSYTGTALSTGDEIQITGVVIQQGSGSNSLNSTWIIAEGLVGSFKLGVDSHTWGIYSSGGTITKTIAASQQLIDQGDGTLATSPSSSVVGTINYLTGDVTITNATSGQPTTIDFDYFPGLPVMGIRTQEVDAVDNENTIVFDTIYAYMFNGLNYTELPSTTPTTWTGTNYNFFWSTNYWTDPNIPANKLFWVTNFSGVAGDPIRYYNNVTWTNFAPQIDAAANLLNQCLALLPFRGRLLAFNTLEGTTLAGSTAFYQRIRWSAIGNPIPNGAYQPWRDDVRGQGGFLDIPTSENITAVGFVRDNLVIYCERSTWQLRYTGRSIAPFQIEKVNSELGSYSLFSAVQFDTSLVGIGDKGIVECNSNSSQRIDIKIPDLVFEFSGNSQAPQRVAGIRDIQQRLAYWTYVDNNVVNEQAGQGVSSIYPNRRLVYNYENDSWAIFTDSLTAFGTYQNPGGITWAAADRTWEDANFPWVDRPSLFPNLIGGNQQGFVMYLGSNLSPQVSNDPTLFISNITGPVITITSPNHNLVTGQVISVSSILANDPYVVLNGGIYGITIVDTNNFTINTYDPADGQFTGEATTATGTYLGGGLIATRDNFDVISKKFNFLDNGQNIQMGYLDLLMNSTSNGAITMNVYINYNNNSPVNAYPQNISAVSQTADDFFNTTVPTSQTQLAGVQGSKYLQRVYCPVRGAFITIEYTLSNAQLAGVEQENDVQIDMQILWLREAGRLQTF
jgi:hypothetical protein